MLLVATFGSAALRVAGMVGAMGIGGALGAVFILGGAKLLRRLKRRDPSSMLPR